MLDVLWGPVEVYENGFIAWLLRGLATTVGEVPDLVLTAAFRATVLRILGSDSVWGKRVVESGVVVSFKVGTEVFPVPVLQLQEWLSELQTNEVFNEDPNIYDLLVDFMVPDPHAPVDTEHAMLRTLRLYLYAHQEGSVDDITPENRSIHVACDTRAPMTLIGCLVESGVCINTKNVNHKTPLAILGEFRDHLSISKMRYILLRGARVEALDLHMNTAMHTAALYNNPVGLSLMLLAIDNTKINPLVWRNRSHELPLNLLVKAWSPRTAQDIGGVQGSIIMRMIEAGADPNHQKLLDNTTIATMQEEWHADTLDVFCCIDFRLVKGLESIGFRVKFKDVCDSIDMATCVVPSTARSFDAEQFLVTLFDTPFKFNDQPCHPVGDHSEHIITIRFAYTHGRYFTAVDDTFASLPYMLVIKLPFAKCISLVRQSQIPTMIDKRHTVAHEIIRKAVKSVAAAEALLPVLRAHCCPLMLSAEMLSPGELAKQMLQPRPNRFRAIEGHGPFKIIQADYLEMRNCITKGIRYRFKILSDDIIEKILNYVSPKLTKTFLVEAGYLAQ
ncbi:hypothetical protein T484DRAFT_1855052 [Baffinella frigidus]|nr:hypothetical protein T484DRAFT_1855052 [Cryptophyta sp. CCMP2293]